MEDARKKVTDFLMNMGQNAVKTAQKADFNPTTLLGNIAMDNANKFTNSVTTPIQQKSEPADVYYNKLSRHMVGMMPMMGAMTSPLSAQAAGNVMRDETVQIAKKALNNPNNLGDIQNWGIIKEIVDKVESGKDTPEMIRKLGETLSLAGYNLVNPSKRLIR
jgi:hypothetical protein